MEHDNEINADKLRYIALKIRAIAAAYERLAEELGPDHKLEIRGYDTLLNNTLGRLRGPLAATEKAVTEIVAGAVLEPGSAYSVSQDAEKANRKARSSRKKKE